jgi:hypothetical protein
MERAFGLGLVSRLSLKAFGLLDQIGGLCRRDAASFRSGLVATFQSIEQAWGRTPVIKTTALIKHFIWLPPLQTVEPRILSNQPEAHTRRYKVSNAIAFTVRTIVGCTRSHTHTRPHDQQCKRCPLTTIITWTRTQSEHTSNVSHHIAQTHTHTHAQTNTSYTRYQT